MTDILRAYLDRAIPKDHKPLPASNQGAFLMTPLSKEESDYLDDILMQNSEDCDTTDGWRDLPPIGTDDHDG